MSEKRTAWNSTLPAPSHPIKRSGPIKAKGKPRFRVSGKPDKAFRAWIREQRCVLYAKPGHTCRGPVEACHVRSRGAGGCDEANLFPCCARGHSESHVIGRHTFERLWNVSLQGIAAALDAVYRSTL